MRVRGQHWVAHWVMHRWPAIAVAHCRRVSCTAVPVLLLLLLHHHHLLLLLLHQGHVLLLRHGVPGCRGGLKHIRPRMHSAAQSRVEPQARHAASSATATAALLHNTHVRVANRHAHRSAAHLGRAGEAGTSTTKNVRRPHHALLRQHSAHRATDTDGGGAAAALLPLAQVGPASRGASLCIVRLPTGTAVVVSLDLHRDLVPPTTTLLAATALLVAPAGRRRHSHGLHHHLGVAVDVVVQAVVVVVVLVVVEAVVEVIVELAAVVVEVVLGEGKLDGLGVLHRRSRGERRHIAAQQVRRKLQPLHLQLLLQLLELLRRRLRHHHLRIAHATASATATARALVTAATRTALLGLAAAGILGMALATSGVLGMGLAAASLLGMGLAAAMVGVLRDAGLGTPQLSRLAGLVELPDDGVRIQQTGHRHLALFRVDAALVDTVDLVEGLLDLLLAPVTVYVHSQHQCLHLEDILLAHPGTRTAPLLAQCYTELPKAQHKRFQIWRPSSQISGSSREGRCMRLQ
uniref:Uncharacterized protein n=1 Tax=Zea mays TaxID=4577 RepID=C0PE17_MAIZE|nr:unknown [Zea mays]